MLSAICSWFCGHSFNISDTCGIFGIPDTKDLGPRAYGLGPRA